MKNNNKFVNDKVEQKGYTINSTEWTLISKWNKVDREHFSINFKGENPDTKILLTTDKEAAEEACFEFNQGLIVVSEYLFLRSDFYAKVKEGGEDTVIAVWQTIKNEK